ncbi:MAG: imidazoleglycerol-phosphate dehydratase HisB [Clostridiales bacterium]|nr:imidazoleglycerol-phosphate dehydratase HisB [Clostridiales bacterium]
MSRIAEISRETAETRITLRLDLDGGGRGEISTGIGFFDHMLSLFARHGFFDLSLACEGDLAVDCHHSVEDAGIALGAAFKAALGDKAGIARYGSAAVPMDETLVLCAVDLSGRAYLNFDLKFSAERIGGFDTEMAEEFFRAFSDNAGMNLHLKLLDGRNNHHICEAAFKAAARALSDASRPDPRVAGALSTKGVLA